MTPKLPGEAGKQKQKAQDRGTWLALVLVLFTVGGMIALISLVLPDFALMLLVVAGLFFFIAFHYFTWGRWLSARVQRMQEEEEREQVNGKEIEQT